MRVPDDFHVSVKKFIPPKKAPLVSWWVDPSLQSNHAAFARHLEQHELTRICGDQTFGGSKRVIDKFPGKQKPAK